MLRQLVLWGMTIALIQTGQQAGASAVQTPADTVNAAGRRLELTYQYMNPVTYRGRTFGVRQWGQIPSVAYVTRSGWRLYGTGYVYTNAQLTTLFKTDLGLEKEGTFGRDGAWSYTLGYERWFFREDNAADRRVLTNFTEAYLSRGLGDFTASVGTYYMFGTSRLLQTDLGLNYYVGLVDRRGLKVSAEPALLAVWANQSAVLNGLFVAGYHPQTRREQRLLGREEAMTRPFGLVDVEADVPVTLQASRLTWVVDPHVAQPLHTLPGERTRLFFYLTASVTYAIFFKRHAQ